MIVVKLGGAEGNQSAPVLDEVASHQPCILVHGGSATADALGARLGVPARYFTSPSGVVSRHSDPERLEILTLALAGTVNPGIVAALARRHVRALGLSGLDGGLVVGERKTAPRAVENGRTRVVHDDWSASITRVNARLLHGLVEWGYVPVVSPPAITAAGEVVNVDADRLAAQIAIAVGASELVLLTNVPGLLRDPNDSSSVIRVVPAHERASALTAAQGRMKKKVVAAHEAILGGVARVHISPSNVPAPIEAALNGGGTTFE